MNRRRPTLNVAAPVAYSVVSYAAERDLASAVLARAFIDATTPVPDWTDDKRARDAKACALHFLLSLDPDTVALRRLWYTLAERSEPPREQVIAILDAYARRNESCAGAARGAA